jgi:N-acetylglutamate synthase
MQTPQTTVECIENATVAAVSPEVVQALPGWLLPMDSGTVGRAKSAVPLAHHASHADVGLVQTMEQIYAQHGMQACFRLPEVPSFDAMRHALRAKGYRAEQPTLVQLGTTAAMRQVTQLEPAQLDHTPDAQWAAVFLGEGFDAVDGASRVKTLAKAPGSVFASVRQAPDGKHAIAAGAGAFSHGWCSVHGMRTGAAHRGQGLAGRVLAGLALAAEQRGFDNVFLQVEQANTSAQALYRRAGFTTAWTYVYWRLPPKTGAACDGC